MSAARIAHARAHAADENVRALATSRGSRTKPATPLYASNYNRFPSQASSAVAPARAVAFTASQQPQQTQGRKSATARPASAPTAPEAKERAVLDDATSRVSSFLSDSRVLAERATLCKNSGCAYLCTGLTPKFCCRICAKSPGAHGPKCAKRMLPCSRPGCGYAVTGIAEKHCCKACALGRDHGPQCWCLSVALAADNEEDTMDDPMEDVSSAPVVGGNAGSSCQPCDEEALPLDSALAVASTLAVAAAAAPSGDEPAGLCGGAEPVDISDAEVAALQDEVNGNRSSIATNAAIIQALKEALVGCS